MTPRHVLGGVTAPVVTALDAAGRPDADGVRPLIDALAAAQVDSLLLLGSNGEGALLSSDLTAGYLVDVAAQWREIRPGGSVTVNISAPGTTDTMRRAEAALDARPDALLVTPPSYFHHRPDEIEAHLRSIETLGHSWAVYNVPRYACALPSEVLANLLDAEHLIGVKDSSGDSATLAAFLKVLDGDERFAVSQGDERNLVGGLTAGARGIVPGIANLVPELVVGLFRAASGGEVAEAERMQEIVTALTALHGIRPGVPSVKAVLHDRGLLASPTCAPPLAQVTERELDELRAFIEPFDRWLAPRP